MCIRVSIHACIYIYIYIHTYIHMNIKEQDTHSRATGQAMPGGEAQGGPGEAQDRIKICQDRHRRGTIQARPGKDCFFVCFCCDVVCLPLLSMDCQYVCLSICLSVWLHGSVSACLCLYVCWSAFKCGPVRLHVCVSECMY